MSWVSMLPVMMLKITKVRDKVISKADQQLAHSRESNGQPTCVQTLPPRSHLCTPGVFSIELASARISATMGEVSLQCCSLLWCHSLSLFCKCAGALYRFIQRSGCTTTCSHSADVNCLLLPAASTGLLPLFVHFTVCSWEWHKTHFIC